MWYTGTCALIWMDSIVRSELKRQCHEIFPSFFLMNRTHLGGLLINRLELFSKLIHSRKDIYLSLSLKRRRDQIHYLRRDFWILKSWVELSLPHYNSPAAYSSQLFGPMNTVQNSPLCSLLTKRQLSANHDVNHCLFWEYGPNLAEGLSLGCKVGQYLDELKTFTT